MRSVKEKISGPGGNIGVLVRDSIKKKKKREERELMKKQKEIEKKLEEEAEKVVLQQKSLSVGEETSSDDSSDSECGDGGDRDNEGEVRKTREKSKENRLEMMGGEGEMREEEKERRNKEKATEAEFVERMGRQQGGTRVLEGTGTPVWQVPALGDPQQGVIVIRNMVRHELFRACKFITKDSQLAITAPSADMVAKQLGYKVTDLTFAKLWIEQRKNIKKALDSKRSTTSMTIKGVVIRKCVGV